MKKKILFAAIAALISTAAINAQGGGGFPRRTVEERVKTIHEKFDSTFHLEAAKQTKVDTVFADYYRAQDKSREEMMAGGNPPDRDAMRAKMQELAAQRDGNLKAILTEDQMKKWKDELEPSLRPQRGNRPPGQ
jgi:acyl-CoA reductase-like NAD-dependent aldehyde dehydrogenase